jgi:hypothetical protein
LRQATFDFIKTKIMKFFLITNTLLFFFIQSVQVPQKQSSENKFVKTEVGSTLDSISHLPKEKITVIQKPISDNNKNGSGLLLLSGLGIALSALGLSYANKKTTTQLTRWAKANNKKTQFLIAATQIAMMGLAFFQGYNLKMMGYNIANNLQYVFPLLATIGFISIPFFPKKESIVLPQKVVAKKLGFLTIALASLLNVASIGNHIATEQPTLAISQTVQSIDNYVVGTASNASQIEAVNTTIDKETQQQNKRKAVSAGITILSIIGFLILLGTLCAGICMIGLAAGSLGAVFGGFALAALSVAGMVAIVRGNTKKK